MKKLITTILVSIFIIFVILIFKMRKRPEEGTSRAKTEIPPLEVVAEIAQRGDIERFAYTVGEVIATKKAEFYSPFNTYVEDVLTENGEYVKKGKLLIKLQNKSLKLEYQKAFRDYMERRKKYKRLKKDFSDTIKLKIETGLIDAEEKYLKIKKLIESSEIRAPFDGIVAGLSTERGSSVKEGEFLLSLYDPLSLKILCDVFVDEGKEIKKGNRAFIYLPEKNKWIETEVIGVDRKVDKVKRTIKVFVSSVKAMIPGEIYRVKIETARFRDKLRVTKSAVIYRENRPLVFVVKNNVARWIWVNLGIEGDSFIEIKKGVKSGDTVIISNNFFIADRTPVKVKLIKK